MLDEMNGQMTSIREQTEIYEATKESIIVDLEGRKTKMEALNVTVQQDIMDTSGA